MMNPKEEFKEIKMVVTSSKWFRMFYYLPSILAGAYIVCMISLSEILDTEPALFIVIGIIGVILVIVTRIVVSYKVLQIYYLKGIYKKLEYLAYKNDSQSASEE